MLSLFVILPSQPKPFDLREYPAAHVQVKLPGLFTHVADDSQLCVDAVHSFMSENKTTS